MDLDCLPNDMLPALRKAENPSVIKMQCEK